MLQILRRTGRDAGQAVLEYVGLMALAAVVLGGIAIALNPAQFADIATTAICRVQSAFGGGGGCPGPAGGGGGSDDGGSGGSDEGGSGGGAEGGSGGGAEPGGGGGGGGGGSSPNGEDEDDDQPWYCDWFGIGCNDDGGSDPSQDVDIPDGLDPDSDLVKTLLSTERGRETLQWLADNGIEVEMDPDQAGAVWNGDKIIIGEGFDNAAVIVHEANHAKYTEDGRSADANRLDRDPYVTAAIDEEADGTVQQILAAKEFRDAGHDLGPQPAEDQYDTAYAEAKANGASDADAQAAGAQAVNDAFYDGTIVTSNTGQSYPDYYGDYWDSVH